MTRIRVLVGLLWVFAAIAGHQLWTPSVIAQRDVTRNTSVSRPEIEIPATAPGPAEAPAPTTQPRFDVYGNQIDRAVGDYRVDPRGDLYELHAPDTALLDLTPPGA